MPRDTELDRLGNDQQRAFDRQQSAYQAQQQAWDRRSAARAAMNQAYERKQHAYEVQNAAWDELQRTRDRNGPRIEQLNREQESAYESMGRAFDAASAAYDRKDGSARSYADEGKRYKAISQDCVAERRRLVDEIRGVKASHEATKPDFIRAKSEYDSARQAFDRAKSDHERAQAQFKSAKADAEKAKKTFQDRLSKVKAEGKKRKDDKRELAIQAGVPSQYLDDVWVSRDTNGNVNIYFGGAGSPNGPGHGHYVLDASGNVIYQRDPYDPHGSHNFKDHKEPKWEYGGKIDGEPAKVREDGQRVEALWGGHPMPDNDKPGFKHGHIVTNDGVNADYVRLPGEKKPIVDEPRRD